MANKASSSLHTCHTPGPVSRVTKLLNLRQLYPWMTSENQRGKKKQIPVWFCGDTVFVLIESITCLNPPPVHSVVTCTAPKLAAPVTDHCFPAVPRGTNQGPLCNPLPACHLNGCNVNDSAFHLYMTVPTVCIPQPQKHADVYKLPIVCNLCVYVCVCLTHGVPYH